MDEIIKNLKHSYRERLNARHKIRAKIERAEDKLDRLEKIPKYNITKSKQPLNEFYIFKTTKRIEELKSDIIVLDEKLVCIEKSINELSNNKTINQPAVFPDWIKTQEQKKEFINAIAARCDVIPVKTKQDSC